MEDHYVRAHTALGSDLILIPLHQAVAELEGLEGLQVHRSWWVSRAAVAGIERDGRSLRLKLRNGVSAPVSRRAVAALKAAAWIG
jgi:DNA-binding LytR/AlgR family response regulator